MRTLKKSLALVLALVMVLGLAVVGASADNAIDKFEDSDQIGDAYLEAVGVLTGLAIVDGMTDTEIAPQGTYQRDQAAKIIAYMVLGKEAADSLVASYAPFQDVPADYWAAGYIAFCKEQGIIDGVSETSFDPYGTLTGFQWAKMLLAAVGFNANNELEGDSWSLNTARTGHEVGLFDGDNAGADHVALRREQAMLYAFNTLTNVRQVSYTGNGNNYVYDIFGYEWADGTGYTLGAEVFDLTYVEGQVVDNEGMGNANTVVANVNYEDPGMFWWMEDDPDYVDIDANTGLDLMYHAVRIWYVEGKTNTNVYVNDLATVTTYECLDLVNTDGNPAGIAEDAIDDLPGSASLERATIGEIGQAYESYLIDNTALDLESLEQDENYVLASDYAYVTLKADFATKGYEGKTETSFTGNIRNWNEDVDNDIILTDMTDIAYGDDVIVVWAASNEKNTNQAWYAYPVTTTEGIVDKYVQENGNISIVLTDGTELEISVFWNEAGSVKDNYKLDQNYVFVLDTHGDVIYATNEGARDLYYYDGDSRIPDSSAWSSDYYREYRFVNVTTGEELIVPMERGTVHANKYYDVRPVAGTDGLYRAYEVQYPSDNIYAGEYVIDNFTFTWTSGSAQFKEYAAGAVTNETVYFDIDELLFVVAVDEGKDMHVEKYEGIDKLAEDYPAAANSTFTLHNACFTITSTKTGNPYATVVFVDDDALTSSSNYLFIPENVSADKWHEVDSYGDQYLVSYDKAYLDGEQVTVYFYVDANDSLTGDVLKRGFYTYVYNSNGNHKYTILDWTRVANGENCAYGDNNYYDVIDMDGEHWLLNGKYDAYESSVKVVDLTNNLVGEEESLDWLWQYDSSHQGANVRLAFTFDDDDVVTVIYVMDKEWHNSVKVVDKASTLADWTVVDDGYEVDVDEDSASVTFEIKYTGAHDYQANDQVNVNLTYKGTPISAVATCIYGGEGDIFTATITVNDIGWDYAEVELDSVNITIGLDMADEVAEGFSWAPETYYDDQADKTVSLGESVTFVCERTGKPGSSFTPSSYNVTLNNGTVLENQQYDNTAAVTINLGEQWTNATYTVVGMAQ